MKRKEEILKFAHDYSEQNYKGDSYEAYAEKEDIAKACIDSINWADSHPRKGLVDIEKVIGFLKEHATVENSSNINIHINGACYHFVNDFIEDLRKAMVTES